jgi:hypothetical protein
MRIKISIVGPGLHPSEVVIALETREGVEGLVIDKENLDEGGYLHVGWPVGGDANDYLVELPRETFRGRWRVWMKKDRILPDSEPARKTA